MPLIRSTTQTAFHDNLKTLLDEGRSLKQALAIAYSEQRKAAAAALKRRKAARARR